MKGSNIQAFWRKLGLLALMAILGLALAVGSGACGPPQNGEPTTDAGSDSGNPADDSKPTDNNPADDNKQPDTNKPDSGQPDANKPDENKPDTPIPTTGSGDVQGAKAASSGQNAPLDASPSPDGKTIYYTAFKKAADDPDKPNEIGQNEGALFKVPAAGGTPTELAGGFQNPTGLVVSKDGKTIYVADSGATKTEDDGKDDNKTGAIYAVPEAGGSKTMIAETQGYEPRSMDLVSDPADQIYFSGVDPADGKHGVFRVAASGGTVNVVSKDDKITGPGGVAVTKDGTVYVAETVGGSGGNSSSIYKIKDGKLEEAVSDIKVGYPAGIALSQDETHLLVSGIKPVEGTSVVYRIKLADNTIAGQIDKDIADNTSSAGLHRAHGRDIFAWADASFPDAEGNGGGRVYLVFTAKDPNP